MTYTPRAEIITGADLSGSSGDANRTYVLTNDDAVIEQMQILVAEAILQNIINFTFDTATNTVTFIKNVWDDQAISIDYLTNDTTSTTLYIAKVYNLNGSDCSGTDGSTGRVFQFLDDTPISAQMSITRNEGILQNGTNFTVDTDRKTVTFSSAIFDADDIVINFYEVGTTYYTTPLQSSRYAGIGVVVDLENLGTGDNSERSFDANNGNILSGSFTLRYGAEDSNNMNILVEGTDYLLSKDDGRVLLLQSGLDLLDTNELYLSYTYSPRQSETVLNSYMSAAQAETDKLTGNYWGVAKTSTQYYDGYDSGYPMTDEPFGQQIDAIPEFELDYKGINSITSIVFLDRTGDIDTTVDSDYIDYDENGRVILNNQTIPNGKRNVKITFVHGYTDVPAQIQELTGLITGMMALINISGGSYKDVSTYTLGRKSFSIGQIYINVETSINQMKSRIESILSDVGPRFGCV